MFGDFCIFYDFRDLIIIMEVKRKEEVIIHNKSYKNDDQMEGIKDSIKDKVHSTKKKKLINFYFDL